MTKQRPLREIVRSCAVILLGIVTSGAVFAESAAPGQPQSCQPFIHAATPTERQIEIAGADFEKGATVTLIAPDGTSTILATDKVTWISSDKILVKAVMGQVGQWKAKVINPGKHSSNPQEFLFTIERPAIQAIHPEIPSAQAQLLAIKGANFGSSPLLGLTSPKGECLQYSGSQFVSAAPDEILLIVKLDSPGEWQAVVTNSELGPSIPFQLLVQVSAVSGANEYRYVLAGSSVLLVILIAAVLIGLYFASRNGQWSLGAALSEEANRQPPEITTNPSNLVLLPSSSRLIALIGLPVVILLFLGIGYAVIWNLFVHGSAPSLSSARFLLFGAALLFAPYLANQLRAVFDSSQGESTAVSQKPIPPGPPMLSAIIPPWPVAAAAHQRISFTGSGFTPGTMITLTSPVNVQSVEIPVSLYGTVVELKAILAMPGKWKAQANNPGGGASPAFAFTVFGSPVINTASTVHSRPDLQEMTFRGSGFMQGIAISIQPAGGIPSYVEIKALSPTEVIVAVKLQSAGPWLATFTNPGPHVDTVNFEVL